MSTMETKGTRVALAPGAGKDLPLTFSTQGPKFPSEDLPIQLGDGLTGQ